jgi:hypothetical protein
MSEYEAQAHRFLSENKLSLKLAWQGNEAPSWATDGVHGDKFRVTIKRKHGNSLTFDFWGSYNDKQHRRKPSAYSVLACISGDAYCPDTFEMFCSEYGYDEDSRKAEAIFKRALEFSRKLNDFFSEEEIEKLGEIQ